MGTLAWAFVRRDFLSESTYRLAFLARMARLIGMLFVFFFISKALNDATGPHLLKYNADYFHYVLLGLAFLPFIRISVNSMAQVVQQNQQTGTLEMLCLSPTPLPLLLIMSTLWQYSQAVLESVVYLSAATFILGAQFNWGNMLTAIGVTLFVIWANMGIGLAGAAFVLITKRASPFIQFFSILTLVFSGLYFPTEVLPSWVQRLSNVLPATYAFAGIRNTLLAGDSAVEIAPIILSLLGFGVLCIPLGIVSMNYAMQRTKADGSLSQY